MIEIRPDLINLPTPFQIIVGGSIVILVLRFFIKEIIKNCKQKRQKPIKIKIDTKKRIERANKLYYKKIKRLP